MGQFMLGQFSTVKQSNAEESVTINKTDPYALSKWPDFSFKAES